MAVAALTASNEARYWSEITIFAYPTCTRRPRCGDSHQNIAMTFGTQKLEWFGYPMVKNFGRDDYSF